MSAEFVGLEDGAVGEFTAGQACRKPKVVFNPHAAAGLPPGCCVFEHCGPQPFGGAINGGRQACWTRTHNHHVVHQILQRLPDADGVGELPVGRIAQEQHRAADYDGRIGLRHPEILKQPVHIRIGFDVHPREEDAIFR